MSDYSPMDLFYQMVSCCSQSYEDLSIDVTEKMRSELLSILADIESKIKRMYSNDKLRVLDEITFLDSRIDDFVSQFKTKGVDKITYALTKCHKTAVNINHKMDVRVEYGTDKPSTLESDLKKLEELRRICCCRDIEAASARTLKRLTVGKSSEKQSNNLFSVIQEYYVRFVIEKVLPESHTQQENSYLSVFLHSSAKDKMNECITDYASRFQNHEGLTKAINDNCVRFRTEINTIFDKLYSLQTDGDIREIGALLIKLYNSFSSFYMERNLVEYKVDLSVADRVDDKLPLEYDGRISSEGKRVDDNPALEYDGCISSHIANFLRWIRIPNTEEEEFMCYVSYLNECVRDSVCQNLNASRFTFDEFKYCKKDGCEQDSLFLTYFISC